MNRYSSSNGSQIKVPFGSFPQEPKGYAHYHQPIDHQTPLTGVALVRNLEGQDLDAVESRQLESREQFPPKQLLFLNSWVKGSVHSSSLQIRPRTGNLD